MAVLQTIYNASNDYEDVENEYSEIPAIQHKRRTAATMDLKLKESCKKTSDFNESGSKGRKKGTNVFDLRKEAVEVDQALLELELNDNHGDKDQMPELKRNSEEFAGGDDSKEKMTGDQLNYQAEIMETTEGAPGGNMQSTLGDLILDLKGKDETGTESQATPVAVMNTDMKGQLSSIGASGSLDHDFEKERKAEI